MKIKTSMSSLFSLLLLLSFDIKAEPSTVAEELAKQKKYADDLMVSINSGKYSGKQLEALKILHQKILDFPIPSQEELDKRYEDDQNKKTLAVIDRDNRKMGILPMNSDRMEMNADRIDRNTRAEGRGAGSSTPD